MFFYSLYIFAVVFKIVFIKLKKFDTAFIYTTDTWWLFNHVLDVIFSSAVKVLREEIPDNADTEEKIFSLLFAALEPHLK
ncbi:MAG: hypothetical protein IKJ93_02360 [Clostridia bacterium]|nr:hypothetical protein [Clostridia bacterium]